MAGTAGAKGPHQARKRVVRVVGGAAALLLAGSVGSASAAYAEDGGTGRGGEGRGLTVDGRFAPASAFVPPRAVSYDPALVPAGGWIRIEHKTDGEGTTVTVRVKGLKPGHAFGMHVHEKACGVDPKAAGLHYQHVKDPKLVDPDNEVWLDFTTDAAGGAETSAHHTWGLPQGVANSVVLHREQGGAGERVGCFTVPFGDFTTGVK
ncbi:superoxide dismutase family protein [Streptomyces sp. NBC_00237]|uniref:superoxide dismutase family protein n=1 Tax=Streptomyces sp. NBC_00237 TaxID=2975687 RepID=UPI00225767A1|nr:superoxide dismutase family protein [Streptomyces sp. NBC_00237]MCX5201455.1 superoxide dismutase family protein [Streptomyces sp. NBC_00237]